MKLNREKLDEEFLKRSEKTIKELRQAQIDSQLHDVIARDGILSRIGLKRPDSIEQSTIQLREHQDNRLQGNQSVHTSNHDDPLGASRLQSRPKRQIVYENIDD